MIDLEILWPLHQIFCKLIFLKKDNPTVNFKNCQFKSK